MAENNGSEYTDYGGKAANATVVLDEQVILGRPPPRAADGPLDPSRVVPPELGPDDLNADETQLAASMFQETRSIQPGTAGEEELSSAIQLMASVVRTQKWRIGKPQIANPVLPSDDLLRNAKEAAAWKRAVAAVRASRGVSGADINKFVFHVSNDGATPTVGAGQTTDKWVYDHADKIVMRFGPFRNQKTHDVPTSDRVYFFFYSGVP